MVSLLPYLPITHPQQLADQSGNILKSWRSSASEEAEP